MGIRRRMGVVVSRHPLRSAGIADNNVPATGAGILTDRSGLPSDFGPDDGPHLNVAGLPHEFSRLLRTVRVSCAVFVAPPRGFPSWNVTLIAASRLRSTLRADRLSSQPFRNRRPFGLRSATFDPAARFLGTLRVRLILLGSGFCVRTAALRPSWSEPRLRVALKNWSYPNVF